jgi:hypothetical protein
MLHPDERMDQRQPSFARSLLLDYREHLDSGNIVQQREPDNQH